MYAEAEIPVVWLINLNESEIEVHQFPQGGKYKQHSTYQAGEMFPIPSFDKELAVDEVFGS